MLLHNKYHHHQHLPCKAIAGKNSNKMKQLSSSPSFDLPKQAGRDNNKVKQQCGRK